MNNWTPHTCCMWCKNSIKGSMKIQKSVISLNFFLSRGCKDYIETKERAHLDYRVNIIFPIFPMPFSVLDLQVLGAWEVFPPVHIWINWKHWKTSKLMLKCGVKENEKASMIIETHDLWKCCSTGEWLFFHYCNNPLKDC